MWSEWVSTKAVMSLEFLPRSLVTTTFGVKLEEVEAIVKVESVAEAEGGGGAIFGWEMKKNWCCRWSWRQGGEGEEQKGETQNWAIELKRVGWKYPVRIQLLSSHQPPLVIFSCLKN